MKVLLLNALYTPYLLGGAERVVQSLAEGLADAGHEPIVITTAPQKGNRLDQVNGIKVYNIGLRNVYWPWGRVDKPKALKLLWHTLDTYNPWMAREVARILDAEHPDVVHTNNLAGFSPLVWQRVKERAVPLVHTLHGSYLLCPRTTMFRDGKNCEKQCAVCRPFALPRERLCDAVDVVVSVSRFTLERHTKLGVFAGTPEKRVIFNACHMQPSVLSSDARPLPIRFGYLGLLDPTKGIDVLLASVTQLPRATWSLDVAGEGPTAYERYLRSQYEKPPVRFWGRSRPELFFPSIDVLVVPSIYNDPLPTVIIEALTWGVPVIGSTRGGIPELVADGHTGFLFDPDRPGDLLTKMQRYIDEPSLVAGMREACLKNAERFLPANVVERYLETYVRAVASA
jgi:glycosyltransferase involved in cell wall biosynthesis